MITSSHNPKIRLIRDLQGRPKERREVGAFLIEGVRLLEEALAANWPVQLALYSETLSERGQALVRQLRERGVSVETATPDLLQSISDTEAPQGLLAVVAIQALLLPSKPNFILILDNLRDPGNIGTILRTAGAAGVQATILSPGTTDPYAPKVVRSAMGAHFRLPIHNLTWPEIRTYLGKDETSTGRPRAKVLPERPVLRTYLADAAGELVYTRADFRSPLVFIIGGEAEGASPESRALADDRVTIPMPGQAESLNAAVAAAILLFETVRQRREHSVISAIHV